MAKETKAPEEVKDVATKEKAHVPALPLKIRMVSLDEGDLVPVVVEGLPKEFATGGQKLSGFPPSPDWLEPGDTIFGHFIRMRTEIGPNLSRLYEIAAITGPDTPPRTVSIWGTSAIDRLIDSANPALEPGDKISFTFLGDKDTKRGLNPVKLFEIHIADREGSRQNVKAS